MSSVYDGRFCGNDLVAGRTGYGKTRFLEKLAINKFFGDIVKTEWISGIGIDKKQEAEIQSCFSNETEIHIGKEAEELDTFKLRSDNETTNDNSSNNHSFGENKKLDRLIVMDDVSGVADVSKNVRIF